MWRIREAVVVEGRYDVIRLRSFLDTIIVETDGFQIFKDKDQLALLRTLAATRGLVVLTDSDGAGFVIRDHLASCIPPEQIKHACIPAVLGKEKRKAAPSSEGLLGVEGLDTKTLQQALLRAGVTMEDGEKPTHLYMTTARFYADGFSGRPDSRAKREKLCRALGLPPRLSTARLIAVLNAAFSEEEYEAAVRCGEEEE
ncbi:MAG: DUF4093 domain-containing protein [Clostridia bacterium]|nr:DUF4093 domain-containing protein [Clostridia bacterium]